MRGQDTKALVLVIVLVTARGSTAGDDATSESVDCARPHTVSLTFHAALRSGTTIPSNGVQYTYALACDVSIGADVVGFPLVHVVDRAVLDRDFMLMVRWLPLRSIVRPFVAMRVGIVRGQEDLDDIDVEREGAAGAAIGFEWTHLGINLTAEAGTIYLDKFGGFRFDFGASAGYRF